MNTYRKYIVLILLPALCWLVFNSVYYKHNHYQSSGIVVTHAHPFDLEDSKEKSCTSHEHSENDYLLFDLLTEVTVLVFTGLIISEIIRNFEYALPVKRSDLIPDLCNQYILSYRGPPIPDSFIK